MSSRPSRRRRRRGIAAVEMATVAPLLLFLLVGIWEVGCSIMVQNILDNAAREGGRLSASNCYLSSSNHLDPSVTPNTPLTLNPAIGTATQRDYEVQQRVVTYLKAAGLDTTNVTVTVSNAGNAAKPKNWTYTYKVAGNTGTGS